MPAHPDEHFPEIPVLYEDNHVLVVVKPVNIPTQEDDSGDKDMLTALKEDLKLRHGKPGNVFLGLVHRLDRPVGGAMVFAKTSKAASRLSEAVRSRTFGKTYLAIVHGQPKEETGRLRHHLLKDSRTNMVRTVPEGAEGAKEALLDYRILGQSSGLTLVKITLLTGRSHQIRVQFATIGCPLYGDQKYGANRNQPGTQIALWSTEIAFNHPTRPEERLSFVSRPPQEHPWSLWSDKF
ncbi:MAG: RluA family pseudouridine synthase [Gorillibacterium sp.]|nr:RluA family pseudouridine synthase [Gorillibacterium sp.]